jgi:hypothetical protein
VYFSHPFLTTCLLGPSVLKFPQFFPRFDRVTGSINVIINDISRNEGRNFHCRPLYYEMKFPFIHSSSQYLAYLTSTAMYFSVIDVTAQKQKSNGEPLCRNSTYQSLKMELYFLFIAFCSCYFRTNRTENYRLTLQFSRRKFQLEWIIVCSQDIEPVIVCDILSFQISRKQLCRQKRQLFNQILLNSYLYRINNNNNNNNNTYLICKKLGMERAGDW